MAELAAYWAYDVLRDGGIESMQRALNDAGPWSWDLRESAWYGDYLAAYPADGCRIRIHEYPFEGEAGTFIGLRERGFSILLDIKAGAAVTEADIDAAFRAMLDRIGATGLMSIEPYD
jgi:hypothetical protein